MDTPQSLVERLPIPAALIPELRTAPWTQIPGMEDHVVRVACSVAHGVAIIATNVSTNCFASHVPMGLLLKQLQVRLPALEIEPVEALRLVQRSFMAPGSFRAERPSGGAIVFHLTTSLEVIVAASRSQITVKLSLECMRIDVSLVPVFLSEFIISPLLGVACGLVDSHHALTAAAATSGSALSPLFTVAPLVLPSRSSSSSSSSASRPSLTETLCAMSRSCAEVRDTTVVAMSSSGALSGPLSMIGGAAAAVSGDGAGGKLRRRDSSFDDSFSPIAAPGTGTRPATIPSSSTGSAPGAASIHAATLDPTIEKAKKIRKVLR